LLHARTGQGGARARWENPTPSQLALTADDEFDAATVGFSPPPGARKTSPTSSAAWPRWPACPAGGRGRGFLEITTAGRARTFCRPSNRRVVRSRGPGDSGGLLGRTRQGLIPTLPSSVAKALPPAPGAGGGRWSARGLEQTSRWVLTAGGLIRPATWGEGRDPGGPRSRRDVSPPRLRPGTQAGRKRPPIEVETRSVRLRPGRGLPGAWLASGSARRGGARAGERAGWARATPAGTRSRFLFCGAASGLRPLLVFLGPAGATEGRRADEGLPRPGRPPAVELGSTPADARGKTTSSTPPEAAAAGRPTRRRLAGAGRIGPFRGSEILLFSAGLARDPSGKTGAGRRAAAWISDASSAPTPPASCCSGGGETPGAPMLSGRALPDDAAAQDRRGVQAPAKMAADGGAGAWRPTGARVRRGIGRPSDARRSLESRSAEGRERERRRGTGPARGTCDAAVHTGSGAGCTRIPEPRERSWMPKRCAPNFRRPTEGARRRQGGGATGDGGRGEDVFFFVFCACRGRRTGRWELVGPRERVVPGNA